MSLLQHETEFSRQYARSWLVASPRQMSYVPVTDCASLPHDRGGHWCDLCLDWSLGIGLFGVELTPLGFVRAKRADVSGPFYAMAPDCCSPFSCRHVCRSDHAWRCERRPKTVPHFAVSRDRNRDCLPENHQSFAGFRNLERTIPTQPDWKTRADRKSAGLHSVGRFVRIGFGLGFFVADCKKRRHRCAAALDPPMFFNWIGTRLAKRCDYRIV